MRLHVIYITAECGDRYAFWFLVESEPELEPGISFEFEGEPETEAAGLPV